MFYICWLIVFLNIANESFRIERLSDVHEGYYYIDNTQYPIPFSPVTPFQFGFPDRSIVLVKIYAVNQSKNNLEREFYTIAYIDTLDGGMYQAEWFGLNKNAEKAPEGKYQYHIRINSLKEENNTVFESFSRYILISD